MIEHLVACVLFVMLAISVFFNIRFGVRLLMIEDTVEECLDTIDKKYAKMSEILSRPLFFDSPEVRGVVNDVRETRNALHKIAYVLDNNFDKGQDANGDVG